MTVVPLPAEIVFFLAADVLRMQAATWEADVHAGWKLQESPGMIDCGAG